MKKILTSILSLGLAASAALAADTITAVKVSDVNDAASWAKAKFSSVTLYPQTAVHMNDKKANAANADDKAKKADVAALYDGKNIALMVKWADGSKSVQGAYSSDTYSDGFAVQFAGATKGSQALPYIGMGSNGRPVVVHLQKATEKVYEPNGNKDVSTQINRQQTGVFGQELADYDAKVASLAKTDYERVFVAEGFRSLTEIKDGSVKSNASMSYANNGWSGTVVRPLKDDYVNFKGTVPVAIAVWDGDKMGRNGLKNLSSWVAVNLEGMKPDTKVVAEVTEESKGNAEKGKVALDANGCAGCHQITSKDAPSFMGPSLANVGGYSTVAYLRESILKPSAVVVPGYNRNAHSNTPWYTIEKGKRISAMTDFSFLDKKTVEDIVAYLKTLKAEVE
ncbi:ethylbenzene dehydrogenase-related protein [Sulfuricurvum sp.]|uniref:ethylbenzene dehydrogenase-related protein n=1 Tax=Sulfuricurvum sp. TaxID=2025608 RepID=UPI0026215808|nr:ethylbenzene dehydrogenase-related protein [Sulfuricurvum sp.]MDD2267775.1 ethylbenzene dehydrogenase-related protein [Sulfuricurvum sp.]MDD2783790.1 ethylbenzene dehydrogenase-related protein [Sulfuricurvum sp.]